ncbi:protein FAM227A isoform X1 [Salmo trutta]|uniref:protein FAM227A isoform X1 n=1 Tax=Salmo trutta TaxID=8032 RepID=UPI001130F3EF|nr:protein FAM227A isoform X1 [Salmo trutta]XP_029581714.1 protein FAM227A isoform X1 [Salmo trutta]XP_029581715.1 protein FAM227A isoform X1 [Salmo trutta]
MADISEQCAPIVVYQEDVSENPVTARSKKESLQESSRTPASCLVGSMGTLSARIARLPPLFSSMCYDSGQTLHTHLAAIAEGKDRQDKAGSKFTRLSSQQDSSTSLQNRRRNMPAEKREVGMPKLVELYQYPGFRDDMPMPLPHSNTFSTIITHVVRAQPHLTDKPRYKAVFQSILSSSMMEDFVIDSFWWLFLQHFQPDARIQDSLFARIAENYIQILIQSLTSRSGKWFLREFPSTLAQTLYCCFCCCFPQSCRTLRSDTFLIPLCFTAYQWTGGICPAPDVFKKWDFEALEPEEATHVQFVSGNKRNEKESDSCLSLLDSMFSSAYVDEPFHSKLTSSATTLLRKKPSSLLTSSNHTTLEGQPSKSTVDTTSTTSGSEGKTMGSANITGTDLKALTGQANQTPARESHVAYPGVVFKRSVFNVYGNSPLVQYYMRVLHMDPKVGQDVLVARTEISKLPPAGSVTYRDILSQAQERSVAHRRDLRTMWGQYSKELYVLNQRKLDERYENFRKQKKILSQKTTTKRLCQLLVPETINEEDTRTSSEVMHAFEIAVSGLDKVTPDPTV